MKKRKIISFVFGVTVGAALLLSSFVTLQSAGGGAEQSKEVLWSEGKFILTDENLVDVFHDLSLHTPISKVKWSKNVLTVDLKVTENSFIPSDIYIDMASIASFSMEHTANVNQLMLRVLAEDEWAGAKHLLLSADVRRSQWDREDLMKLREWKSSELPRELIQRFHMTETNLWKELFNSRVKGQ